MIPCHFDFLLFIFFFWSYAVLPPALEAWTSLFHAHIRWIPNTSTFSTEILTVWKFELNKKTHFHFVALWIFFFFDVYISSCFNQAKCAHLQFPAHSHPFNLQFLLPVWWKNMAEGLILGKTEIWKFNSTRASSDGLRAWLKLYCWSGEYNVFKGFIWCV